MNIFNKKNKQKIENFVDMPAKDQKKLVSASIIGSNRLQLAIIEEYEKRRKTTCYKERT